MKYGVNLMVWTTHIGPRHDALFSCIQEWGFDGVEFFLSPDEPTDISSVKRTLDRLGLERTMCSVLPREANLVSPDASVRARGVHFLTRCVERTAEFGANLICGPLYAGLGVMTGSRRTEQEWEWAVQGLRAAASRGKDLGVTLCVEPVNRFETYFLNTLQDASQFVRDVGASNICIHFDTFHSNIEEQNVAKALRAVAKDLGHVHISENDRGIPGSGHVDWRGVLSVLKEVGYDGWLTIESFAEPEPELAAAASIWRDLAPSGDELARRGLRFIKNLSSELGIV
ncbi:MAG: sugar phosphate isomerase/epimerase family protein [Acidobacteriaceae bacterium]